MIHNWKEKEQKIFVVEYLTYTADSLLSKVVYIANSFNNAANFVRSDGQSDCHSLYRISSMAANSDMVFQQWVLDSSGNVLEGIPQNPYMTHYDGHILNCTSCRNKAITEAAKHFYVNQWHPSQRAIRELSRSFSPTGRVNDNGAEVVVRLNKVIYCQNGEISFNIAGPTEIAQEHI